MFKIKRFFNQNKTLIITIIIIVVAAFLGLRLLNYFVKMENERIRQQNANKTVEDTYNRDYEIMSGDTKSENTYTSESNKIKNFINYLQIIAKKLYFQI